MSIRGRCLGAAVKSSMVLTARNLPLLIGKSVAVASMMPDDWQGRCSCKLYSNNWCCGTTGLVLDTSCTTIKQAPA